MSESRTELLAWLNDLLQISYTKVEQCGNGAAHCQIMDSIFRDVPLTRVKFNAKHEYEYINNFKILQSTFDKHKIDNFIPVERLVKCKFQDNLEFLQWMKKYWDQYYPGGQYDALARRKGEAGSAPPVGGIPKASIPKAAPAPKAAPTQLRKAPSNSSIGSGVPKPSAAGRTPVIGAAAAAAGGATGMISLAQHEREKGALEADYQKVVQEMTQQTMELKVTVEQVEKEREFYFNKLREIEIFVQQNLEASGVNGHVLEPGVEDILKEIQGIMYKTEDGFEVPENEGIEEEVY
ncbi:calponin homology domain-containing protein [Cladochytrium replicatum]|nr:calponin homology domain-containing protein [Cladochytrium replicatum]